MPPIMEYTAYIGIQEIMNCVFATTFPEVGTITKDFKKCVNESDWGRIHFDSVMSVYEGDCKNFSGLIDYNYDDETSGENPYGEMFSTPTHKTENAVSPTKDSENSFNSSDQIEFTIGFVGKDEFYMDPTISLISSAMCTNYVVGLFEWAILYVIFNYNDF